MKLLINTFFILCFASCNNAVKPSEQLVQNIDSLLPITSTYIDTVLSSSDKIDIEKTKPIENKTPSFNALKRIVSDERNFDYETASFVITNKDSITKYEYVNDLFSINEIDSISFYGAKKNYYFRLYKSSTSLLTIHFKNKTIAQRELEHLDLFYNVDFRAIESIFKPGGIAFVIDNQLCLYQINGCSPGYKDILRIDSLIGQTVFKNEPFIRLHAKCGMRPFEKIVD